MKLLVTDEARKKHEEEEVCKIMGWETIKKEWTQEDRDIYYRKTHQYDSNNSYEEFYYSKDLHRRRYLRRGDFERANFPENYKKLQWKHISKDQISFFKNWIDLWEDNKNPNNGLFVFGEQELVKAFFGIITIGIMKRCHTIYCISSTRILSFIEKNEDMKAYQAEEFLIEPELLAVYDFGSENRNDFGVTTDSIARIFMARNNARKATLIASKVTFEDCGYGERGDLIKSAIADGCNVASVYT